MKKSLLAFLLALIMLISLVGCAKGSEGKKASAPPDETAPSQTEEETPPPAATAERRVRDCGYH